MTDHFVEVPKKVLSPAAQAVLDAYYNAAKAVLDICGDFEIGSARNEGIAAALRAAANQDPYGLNTGEYDEGWGEAMATVIAIATTLENAQ